ncbi:MAG TPA: hypothetical protein VKO20_00280 [Desulfosalsimonadaceae bacterium]|nr:hypothetical protein [Desulfosalsimonadaceae bacterium]
MNYPSAMQSVLRLDESIYPAIMASKKTVRYCMANVLVFGLLHAFFSLLFSNALLAESQLSSQLPLATKGVFLLIGVAVAFFMHAGASLFLWVFTRGIGGDTAFFPVYFNFGISFVGLWPLAPVLAAAQAGLQGPALQVLLGLASAYGLAVILFAAKNASGLSLTKIILALIVTIIFIACFLYLWIG